MASMAQEIEIWASADAGTKAALELAEAYDRARSMEFWENAPSAQAQEDAWQDVQDAYDRWLALR